MAGIKCKHLNQYSSPGANPEAAGASEGAEGMCGATQTTGRQEDRELPGEARQPALAPLHLQEKGGEYLQRCKSSRGSALGHRAADGHLFPSLSGDGREG